MSYPNWLAENYGAQMGMQGLPMEQMMAQSYEQSQSDSGLDGQPPYNSNLIGPVMPEGVELNNGKRGNEEKSKDRNSNSRGRSDRRDRTDRNDHGSRDHNRGRRRSRSRDRSDRNDRSRNERRERKSKWAPATDTMESEQMGTMGFDTETMNEQSMAYGHNMQPIQNSQHGSNTMMGNMMMPNGQMMPYANMLPQQMDMQNMGNMMPQNMNMMPGMMDQNMIMMNPQMMPMMQHQQHHALFFNGGVCLPPMPGASLQKRRDKPPGCRTIFVGALPTGISENHLNEIFSRFGQIENLKFNQHGICHIRFDNQQSVEMAFTLAGYKLKLHEMNETDAMEIIIDYASNRDDLNEFERSKRRRGPTPPRVEPLNPNTLASISEKIKNEDKFAEAAPTLVAWLEHGECNKKNANSFYSLIQASNNQIRRLYNDKMQLDEELTNLKTALKDKFAHVLLQFEQVAKILTAAKHQRVSDHFTKQQRRNIEMWLRMTEELDNIREEFNSNFDEDDYDNVKAGRKVVPEDKYDELKKENENLVFELEGYKNEAHVAKDEAERKFEKFKAHFIAQQALQSGSQVPYLSAPPLPPPSLLRKPEPPSTPDPKSSVSQYEAKLLTLISAFLLIHPLGVSIENILLYARSIVPDVTLSVLNNLLKNYTEIFKLNGTGFNGKWTYITLDAIKNTAYLVN